MVNAGHSLPFLLRDGQATQLELTPRPPLGVAFGPYSAEVISLQPGNRLSVCHRRIPGARCAGGADLLCAEVDIEKVFWKQPQSITPTGCPGLGRQPPGYHWQPTARRCAWTGINQSADATPQPAPAQQGPQPPGIAELTLLLRALAENWC